MLTPIIRAFGQLDDPAIFGIVLRTLTVSALIFVALITGCSAEAHHLLAGHGWLATIATALGGLLAVVGALYLFLPVAMVIAGFFIEPVCRAVERRWYPEAPPAPGAHALAQIWDGIVTGTRVLALSVFSLMLGVFMPGIGQLLGWVITAWAVGRGLHMTVAMRRMSRAQALARYREQRLLILVQGGALTLAGAVPILNFLVPVLGPACMVHVVMMANRATR